jgi:predicted nucleotidyltransferase
MNNSIIKTKSNFAIPLEKIEAFCRKWKIKEFALFGSVLRDDFRPDSDVDVLVTFEPNGGFTFENFMEIQEEIEGIFGRKVDLVQKGRIRNPFRRYEILTTKEVVYAA